MIETVWPYLAVVLLAAGLFPTLERSYGWRVFAVLPPIVLTYLLVTALAVGGLWRGSDEIRVAQQLLTSQLLPALLFLLMVGCDLRAILKLGPRVLAVFVCAMTSLLLAIILTYLLFRSLLPADGWRMLAALSATWVGGSANLVAVKEVIGLSEASLSPVLLADALCYSVWVIVLFSSASFAPAFNRWTRADTRPGFEVIGADALRPGLELPGAQLPRVDVRRATEDTLAVVAPAQPGTVLLWLGLAMLAGLGARQLAALMPVSTMLTPVSWTVAYATVAGLVVARTPLARIPGPAPLAGALLACLVAVLGSQSSFAGLASAPVFVLCGFCVLIIHIVLLALAARAFAFDLQLCSIASLAQIGGPASAPLLAATYAKALVPVAVLMAMLGLVLGTGVGLLMARILSALAPAVS